MFQRLHTPRRVILLAFALLLVISISLALSKSPSGDEGLLASVAHTLAYRGFLGVDNIEPATYGNTLGGNLHRFTYWQMPLQFFLEAVPFRALGFSLISARLVSIIFALLLLACFYVFLRQLFQRPGLAAFAALLLSVDYFFCQAAALARNDIIACALVHAALASYLCWYETHPSRAILLSQTCLVLSGMTHPVGGIVGLFCFLALYFSRDTKPFGIRLAALAAFPYVVGGALYGLYILQAPDVFRAQFFSNASGRGRDALRFWTAIENEVSRRYLPVFWDRAGLTAFAKLRLLMLVAYLSGLSGCLVIGNLRRSPPVRTLLLLTAVTLGYLILLDSTKQRTYLVYIVCFYVALLAVFLDWVWQRRLLPRPLLAAGIAAFLAFHAASSFYRVGIDELHRHFYAAADHALRLRTPSSLTVANVKFVFGLGPSRRAFLDDPLVGCASGRFPDIVIRDREFDILTAAHVRSPEVRACVAEVLGERLHLSGTYGEFQLWSH
jgi:hypothetical protein